MEQDPNAWDAQQLPPLGVNGDEVVEFCRKVIGTEAGMYAPALRISWGDGSVTIEADYLGPDIDAITIDRAAGHAFTSTRTWKLMRTRDG